MSASWRLGTGLALVVVAVALLPAWRSGAEEPNDPVLVADYFSDPGIWAPPAEVHIAADGGMTVLVQTDRNRPVPSSFVEKFRLSAEERRALAELVRRADFLGESEPSRPVTCIGPTRLRLALDGRSRETEWISKPALEPLQGWFGRFIHQARLLGALRRGDGIRDVEQALDPRARRIAQPEVFRDPLREFVEKTLDPKEALVALGTLARLEEPGPWAALVSRKVAAVDAAARFPLVEGLVVEGQVSTGRVTRDHMDGILPEALAVVRLRAPAWEGLTSQERDQTQRMLWILARRRYEPAFLALPDMARESVREDWQFDQPIRLACLSCWGERGFDTVLSLLDAEDPRARRSAIGSMGAFLYEKSSWPGRTGPVPEEECERVRRRLRAEALPRLESMAQDPAQDPQVRGYAGDIARMLHHRR